MWVARVAWCFCLCPVLACAQTGKDTRTIEPAGHSNGVLEMVVAPAAANAEGYTRSTGPSPVLLQITFKNLTGSPVPFVETANECNYSVEVRDSSGAPAQMTDAGRKLPRSRDDMSPCPFISISKFNIKPDRQYSVNWDISRYYALEPGKTYDVKVRRWLWLPKEDSAGRAIQTELTNSTQIKVPERRGAAQ